MIRPLPLNFAAVAGVLAMSAMAPAQTCCPGPARKAVYDEFGYARPAPCERAAAFTVRRSHGRFTPAADFRYRAAFSCYPPLKPAAGINAWDRPEEMNWSW